MNKAHIGSDFDDFLKQYDLLAECESAALRRVVAAGLREVKAANCGQFQGLGQVLEKLTGLPGPEEAMALRPSPELAERISQLLTKNRAEGLTPEEETQWQRYELVEHLVRLAKARAAANLKDA